MLIDENDMEKESEAQGEIVGIAMMPPGEMDPDEGLRLQLLMLSKEILLGKAAMRWETHKQYTDVEVGEIINEAQRMFEFVKGPDESSV